MAAPLMAAPTASHAEAVVPAPSGVYVVDPTHANVLFQVSHLGLAPYTARFDTVDATLTLDVDNPANSSVTASVDVGSVSTNYQGSKPFDQTLAFGPKFFNGNEFPKITFTSTGIEQTGDKTATITGDLEMLGVTKPITLAAELTGALGNHPFAPGNPPAVGFTAEGVIDRTDWNFTHLTNALPGGALAVGTEVRILIQAEFIKGE